MPESNRDIPADQYNSSSTVLKTKPVEFQERIIDNPSKGNCGFYAFAIGLISIIKQEENKSTFNKWVALDASIAGYYDAIYHYDFDLPDNELLEILQKILRSIAYNSQLEELRWACTSAQKKDEYKALVAISIYRKFAEIYHDTERDSNYNQMLSSKAIKEALDRIDRSKVVPGHESLILAPLLISLIYGDDVAPGSITVRTPPKNDSPVIQALMKVKGSDWATHLDLDYLADAFEVNLQVLKNGVAPYEFIDLTPRPTITLNNEYNVHWTTRVKLPKDVKKNLPQKNSICEQHKIPEKKSQMPGMGISYSAFFNKIKEPENKISVQVDEELPSSVLEQKKFNQLIRSVNRAVMDYHRHSHSIIFSFFHWHGESGRVRARQFNQRFSAAKDIEEAKEILMDFLKNNNNNGNTHPHSFRTMLLKEMLQCNAIRPLDEKYISKNYWELLKNFETTIAQPQGLR